MKLKFELKLILSKQNSICNKKNELVIGMIFPLYSCGGYHNEILTIHCITLASKHIPVHEVISLLCMQYQTM